MNVELLKETIRQELPGLLRDDPGFRVFLSELMRSEYAGRAETQDRFYNLLAELRRDREERTREWKEYRDEQNQKWNDQNQKWNDQNQKWNDQNQKWSDQNQKWSDHNKKWDDQNRKWDAVQAELRHDREEQNRKWEANQVELRRLHEEIMEMARKHERGIGALGSRWGLQSEKAFRDALAGILEQSFRVQVINVNEYDHEGTVFGRPDQVELDVIIKNGLLLICELKSSIDKAGMYIFERKARFYEKQHHQQANRLLVISPMIDARARKVAERLGIETYGDSSEVEAL
ncbi:DUF3782 domain-containing protein [Gammaproteobacteria bacterium]